MSEQDEFMDKAGFRKKFLQIRKSAHKSLSSDEKQRIFSHLRSVPEFERAKTIMAYHSANTEVPTHELIISLLESGKNVCLPRTNVQDKTITPYFIKSLDELEPSSFGIMEPKEECKICSAKGIDAILLPGIAFDERCGRIGYGLGFYDRFLAGLKIPKIAICYDAQISKEALPAEKFDVPADFVVSEKRVIARKG